MGTSRGGLIGATRAYKSIYGISTGIGKTSSTVVSFTVVL